MSLKAEWMFKTHIEVVYKSLATGSADRYCGIEHEWLELQIHIKFQNARKLGSLQTRPSKANTARKRIVSWQQPVNVYENTWASFEMIH